ncbi:MAG: prepilin-type N-terminal cleavage/methylation domain-containing protein [Dehalococcoidia bacterium]|nr:prepilin-type N-terminal cleavage/methylation domain-containing protein [Dehalococcoidia bacterium]
MLLAALTAEGQELIMYSNRAVSREGRLKRMLLRQRGFTLIELVAVMAILAILVAIVAPAAINSERASITAQAQADSQQVRNAATDFFTRNKESEVRTPHSVTTITKVSGAVATSKQQEVSTRWPEVYITEASTGVPTLPNRTANSKYHAIFHTTGDTVVVREVFLKDKAGTAISGSDLMTKYTAIDLAKLDALNLLKQMPDGVDKTSGTGVGTPELEAPNFLWLFKKQSSSLGTDDDRAVAVFTLVKVQQIEPAGGGAATTVDLTYEQILGPAPALSLWASAPQQSAKLTASDGAANDKFGYSVAISGDTAVVGARFDDFGGNIDQGSAYVFVRSGSAWSQQAKLTASDGAAYDKFGGSVAISGDTIVVGAFAADVGGNTYQGSAYVFVRSGGAWSQQAKLTASDGAAHDHFGLSVAISGDTAVVGANGADVGGNTAQGSAYVYVRSGGAWSQQAKLTASDGAARDEFGLSVAISGDTAVVGAYSADVGSNGNQGSAYVFVRSGGAWTQQAKLAASDGAVSDWFGFSVAISGDTAVVAAKTDDVGSNADQGSAYVFVRSGTTWSQQAKLTASDGAAEDYFGVSVAISGDTAVVGAYWDDVGSNTEQGSAYLFLRSGGAWSQQAKLTASDGAVSDYFGVSVAISGDTAVVGAHGDDVGSNTDQGSAYVFVST